MKHVVKAAAPESFEIWKAQGDGSWQPSYGDLQNPQKRELHQALLNEQGWVCCYCGREIDLSDSHIEHFRPQHPFEDLQLEFANLHASCLREVKPGLPLHCGHAKGNDFEENEVISPLDASCESQFFYTTRGEIKPANHRAQYMIDLLSLNSPALSALRSEVLARTLGTNFLETATDDELIKLRDEYRTQDEDGKLPDFGHVIARYADQYVPKDEDKT